MAIPVRFSSWFHLRNNMRVFHNKRVDQHFRGVPANDISTKKSSLRHAVTIQRTDTASIVLLRKMFFEFDCLNCQSLQAPIYGIPVAELQRDIKFRPQVKLVFRERYPLASNRLEAVRGEITFRLMDESSQSMTPAKARTLATKIKNELFTPLLIWRKGKHFYYYRDFERGYDLRLLVPSKSEGERIARAVVGVQNHSFNSEFVDFTDTDRNFPENPGNEIIYGQSTPKPKRRPTADVRIRHAQLLLSGRVKCINLVSTQESALPSAFERIVAS